MLVILANAGDLAVSKNEMDDVTGNNPSVGGLSGSTEYELSIPSFLRSDSILQVDWFTASGRTCFFEADIMIIMNFFKLEQLPELNTDRFEIEKATTQL